MGAVCCCFHLPHVQDDNNNNSSSDDANSDDCLCPKCFFQKFMNKHGNLFTRQQVQAITSTNQTSSSHSYVVINNSSDTSQSRDRVLLKKERQLRQIANTEVEIVVSKVESQEQSSSVSVENWYGNTLSCRDYEDECPTCLEEYTEENPKIIAKCSHQFHLSCIYEWMERSEECPVCRKLMLFDESS